MEKEAIVKNVSEKTYGNVTVIERSDWEVGVVNAAGEVVVPFGKYAWIDGFEHGLARVRTEGFIRCHTLGGDVTDPAILMAARKRDGNIYAKWGIINEKGEEVVPVKCDYVEEFFGKGKLTVKIAENGFGRKVCCFNQNSCPTVRSEQTCGNVTVIQVSDYQWGVVDAGGKTIVPFGKYDWIDSFDQGLARVKIGNAPNNIEDNGNKWGIINEKGEEVLPVEYDSVWNFAGKNRFSTKVEKGGIVYEVFLNALNSKLPVRMPKQNHYYKEDDDREYGFSINDCYDYEGNFDEDRLEDAIMDGLYVPEDW